MAVVKFIASGCPMNNIFSYVMRDEATERKLIDGMNCMPETALEEFKFVKTRFGKEDGRQYYHIIQSFSPDDNISPEEAHELGMKFAGHFEGFQAVVATHVNKAHLHNHIILNSVNMETGRKYHQSRDEMLAAKRFANDLCREYGLSVTEEKCEYGKMPKWKQQLRSMIVWALFKSPDRETFIEALERHGYGVNWTDGHKYVTFTTMTGGWWNRGFSLMIIPVIRIWRRSGSSIMNTCWSGLRPVITMIWMSSRRSMLTMLTEKKVRETAV